MERIKEMLEDRKAILRAHISEDKGRVRDPIIGRFMEGRIVIEEETIDFIDRVLVEVNKRI